MKNNDMSYSYCNYRRQQSNKRFYNFCKYLDHNIETCYHHNKSVVFISVATVANIESIQPMAPVFAKSKSSRSTITISTIDLQNVIGNTISMVGNAFYSSSLSFIWYVFFLLTYGFCLLQLHDTSFVLIFST